MFKYSHFRCEHFFSISYAKQTLRQNCTFQTLTHEPSTNIIHVYGDRYNILFLSLNKKYIHNKYTARTIMKKEVSHNIIAIVPL